MSSPEPVPQRTIALNLGNQRLLISAGDLVNQAIALFEAGEISVLSNPLTAALNQPLGNLQTGSLEARLLPRNALAWKRNFAGGSLTFNVNPAVEGRLVIRTSGELFRFTESADPEDEAQIRSVVVPTGKAYVSVLFRVSLEAGGAGAFSHGLFGVSAGIGVENSFLLASHSCFDATETVQRAVTAAFERFTVPFDRAALARIRELDYIEYEFFGKLSFALGVTGGFKGVSFGGVSNGALKQTLNSDLGALTAKVVPSFSLSAALDVKWTHEDAYRVVVGAPDPNRLHLLLFKMDTTHLTAGLTVKAGVELGASVEIQSRVDTLIAQAADKVFAKVPDPLKKQELVKLLIAKIKSSPEAINEYVKEAEGQANDFLKKLDKINVTATLTRERIAENTSLFSYDFDAPIVGSGVDLALAGDFAGALAQPGVRLSPGSFIRKTLEQRTSIGLELFETFRISSLTEYFQNSTLVYAGNGIFQLRFTSGMKASSDAFGHRKAIEIYFTVAGRTDGVVVDDRDVQLFIKTDETNNVPAALQTAGALELLTDSILAQGLRSRLEANPSLRVQLTAVFPLAALKRLPFTPYKPDGNPQELPHPQDAMNYAQFVNAVDVLFDHTGFDAKGYPDEVEKFSAWAHYNITANDQEGSRRPPRRHDPGNPNVQAIWPQNPDFKAAGFDIPRRVVVRSYLLAAQSFMNLCEDLHTLATEVEEARAAPAFERVLRDSENLIKKDQNGQPLHFTKPLLLALARVSRVEARTIDAPADADLDVFRICIRFA